MGGRGRGGEEKNSQPFSGIEPPIIQAVAKCYTTELSRLQFPYQLKYTNFTKNNIIHYLGRYSTGLRAGRLGLLGSIPGGAWKFFSSPPYPERLWGLPSLLSSGYQGLSLRVKRPGREADHSPPSSAEVEE
jgi:hypothetical protein